MLYDTGPGYTANSERIWAPYVIAIQNRKNDNGFISCFMNMFGTSPLNPSGAIATMQVASEAQVHYAIGRIYP